MTVGASSIDDRLVQRRAQPRLVARGRQPQAGDDRHQRVVPHAVVARAVGAGDPRAVEDEGDAETVQRDVHQHLVEGPVEERRVEGDDRVQAAAGESGGEGDRVLLGDADVEDALGDRPPRTAPSPVGCSMAAVIATTSGRAGAQFAPGRRRRRSVQRARRTAVLSGSPVTSSILPTAWKRSSSCSSAAPKPLPFSVIAWTMTGPPKFLRLRPARPPARAPSWPSIGPMYFKPEVAEQALRGEDVLDARLEAVHELVDRPTDAPAWRGRRP